MATTESAESAGTMLIPKRRLLIVFDTESTNRYPLTSRVVQIAARAFDLDKVSVESTTVSLDDVVWGHDSKIEPVSIRRAGCEDKAETLPTDWRTLVTKTTFVTYVNPCVPMNAKASEVTKITDDMLVCAPRFKDACTSFFEWIVALGGDEVFLAAHNGAGFDYVLMHEEMLRNGLRPDKMYSAVHRFVDSLTYAQKGDMNKDGFRMNKSGRAVSNAQGDIYYSLFGEELTGAHDAMVDVNGLARILCHDRFHGIWSHDASVVSYKDTMTYLAQRHQKSVDVGKKSIETKLIRSVGLEAFLGQQNKTKTQRKKRTNEIMANASGEYNLADILASNPNKKNKKSKTKNK